MTGTRRGRGTGEEEEEKVPVPEGPSAGPSVGADTAENGDRPRVGERGGGPGADITEKLGGSRGGCGSSRAEG